MVVEYWISWRERKDRRKGAVEILYRVTKRKRQGARECYQEMVIEVQKGRDNRHQG